MFARKNLALPSALAMVAATCAVSASSHAFAQTAVPTSTLLTVRSSGALVNRVPKQTSVQLVAQVQSPTAPLTSGQVRFCEASAPRCTDLHLLGIAQITPAGTAVLSIVPGIGTRAYRAEFLGIVKQYQPSASSNESLIVNGKFPTKTTLSATGTPGSYTLNATVVGTGSAAALAGNVHFQDLTANQTYPTQLGTAALGGSTPGLSLTVAPNSLNLPSQPALGDFNGDGIPDVAGAQNQSVFISLGDGTGGFAAPRTYPAGYYVSTLAVGDFNADGFQDVAAAGGPDGKLVILLGSGDGTLQAPITSSATVLTNTIVVGDFNRDGKADLATIDGGAAIGGLAIFIGQGDGTFRKKLVPLAARAKGLVAADLNGDGIQDLVATEDNSVEALIGGSGATFTTASNTAVGSDPFGVISGDFNGDGVPDIATASFLDYSVSILLGKGDGSFTAGPTAAINGTTAPYALALTDLNQDGIEDIALATGSTVEGVGYQTVLFGSGQGSFNATTLPLPKPYSGGQEYDHILSADLNGDGLPDLIVGPGVLLDRPTQTAQAMLSGVSITGSGSHSVQALTSPATPYNASSSGTIQLQAQ